VTPALGQAGATVTITGSELLGYGTGAVSVTLAGVEVSQIGTQNSTQIVVRAAASSAATGDVVITSDSAPLCSECRAGRTRLLPTSPM
jgi:hypothetical protein